MDFAFAPGVTKYDAALRRIYTNRPATTLIDIPFVDTFRSFITHLNKKTAAHPTQFIMVGSHGDDNAFMTVQFDGARGPNTTYEDLEAADLAHSCEPTNDVTSPRPVDANNNPIPCFLLIKGCRIALSQPFMTKMKDALNGASTEVISVVAPQYYHGLAPGPEGVFECFLYDFKFFSKTKVASKADLVTGLLARNFQDIHGNKIIKAQYEKWIPAAIHGKETNKIQKVTIKPTPVPKFTSHKTGRYRYKAVVVLSGVEIDTSTTPLPAALPDRILRVKSRLAALAANPGNHERAKTLASTHPFPFYVRYGYTSLDELIDNLEWTFNTQDKDQTIATGRRHEYDVNPPIVAANGTDLIFNYYADKGNKTRTVIHFDDRDTRFYITT